MDLLLWRCERRQGAEIIPFAERQAMKYIPYCKICILLICALAVLAVSALSEGEYRTLRSGSYGDDVLSLKGRLYELGYFNGSTFNNRYTDDTVKRVKAFEAACGLSQTGVATPALQSLLFSHDAVSNKSGKNESGNVPSLTDMPDSPYRDLSLNSSGDDVLALKQKLKQLGYFAAKAETGDYNSALADAVSAYQRAFSLAETGEASAALQQEIFYPTQTAVPAATPRPTDGSATGTQTAATALESRYTSNPTQIPANPGNPTSTPAGPARELTLPELNMNGFLADESVSPYVYADRDDGHWCYISQNLFIEIVRMQNKRQNITWFETEVRCTPDSRSVNNTT